MVVKTNLHNQSAVILLRVRVNPLPVSEVIGFICQTILSKKRAVLAYVNVYAINLAQEQAWFRAFLNEAALTFCDGFGVKWGAWLLGETLPYRYTPPDWFPALIRECDEHGFTLYFLGARPGVVEKFAEDIQQQYPHLKVVGTRHGYFNKTAGSAENRKVVAEINALKPDLLVVGMGMPVQERWLAENWLDLNARVALPVGAMFDYLTGASLRAPRWMTEHGLEWMGRLMVEPRRLAKRYLVGNPRFLWEITQQRLGRIP